MKRTERSTLKRLPLALAAALMSLSLGAVAQPSGGSTSPGGGTGATNASGAGTRGDTGPSGATTGSTSGTASSQMDRSDRGFVEKAAMGGMAEVQLGELAQSKGSNPQVKAFGERMVKDHGQANSELKTIASSKGITPPAALSGGMKRDVDKLTKLSGADFDKAYMKHMVEDHEKDVKDFEKASKFAKDADVKAFAAKTLPTLQEHLQMARTTHEAVKKNSK